MCGSQHHSFRENFARPPHNTNHHQNVVLGFLDFHQMFSNIPRQSIEAQDYSNFYFLSNLEFYSNHVKNGSNVSELYLYNKSFIELGLS